MTLVKKLIGFWFVILSACLGAYVLFYNQEPIYVRLPGVGEFKVWSALAFLVSYFLGVTTVTLYFLIDTLKKTFEIRRLSRRLRAYEADQDRLPSRSIRGRSDLATTGAGSISPASGSRSKGGERFPPEGELF